MAPKSVMPACVMIFCVMVPMNLATGPSEVLSAAPVKNKVGPHFQPPTTANIAASLSQDFYKQTCPKAYDVIAASVKSIVEQNPSQAAGILRLMFHDCFVQGCDASLLLEKPVTEQTATPNVNSLRASSLKAVDEVKAAVEKECPGIVSCADTLVLAATIAVQLVGGPYIPIATGRRDSLTAASNQTVTNNIAPPTLNIAALKQNFQNHALDVKDLVALSGGHTIGQAHCRVVAQQLIPTISPDLNAKVASDLSHICLPNSTRAALTVHLDFISKDAFDNGYFKNVLTKSAVFHTDAELLRAADTKQLVEEYAQDEGKFFEQFIVSMVKMSQLGVLTGDKGNIRKVCSVQNL